MTPKDQAQLDKFYKTISNVSISLDRIDKILTLMASLLSKIANENTDTDTGDSSKNQ